MSGAQYNISVLQILESERRLKPSSILKLFQKDTAGEISLKDFIKTFTSEEEPVEITPLEDFLPLLDNSNPLPEVDETPLLALTFVAGYAVHSSYSKYKDRCGECFASLTKQRDIHFENQDSVNLLIQITDRGGLKYPAMEVLESCILLWKIYTAFNETIETTKMNVFRTLNLMKPSILNSISSGAYLSDLHSELAKRLDLKPKQLLEWKQTFFPLARNLSCNSYDIIETLVQWYKEALPAKFQL